MADKAYQRAYAMNKFEARRLLIQTWQETGSTRAQPARGRPMLSDLFRPTTSFFLLLRLESGCTIAG